MKAVINFWIICAFAGVGSYLFCFHSPDWLIQAMPRIIIGSVVLFALGLGSLMAFVFSQDEAKQ